MFSFSQLLWDRGVNVIPKSVLVEDVYGRKHIMNESPDPVSLSELSPIQAHFSN